MGNLTRDPETRVTPGGLTIAKLGFAVNRRYSTKDGEKKEEVTFVDIDAFGTQAETISKYCQKGSSLFIEGRLRLDSWQDAQSGATRSKLNIVLESFQFLGGKGGESDDKEPQREQSPQPSSRPPAKSAQDDLDFDDVPF